MLVIALPVHQTSSYSARQPSKIRLHEGPPLAMRERERELLHAQVSQSWQQKAYNSDPEISL